MPLCNAHARKLSLTNGAIRGSSSSASPSGTQASGSGEFGIPSFRGFSRGPGRIHVSSNADEEFEDLAEEEVEEGTPDPQANAAATFPLLVSHASAEDTDQGTATITALAGSQAGAGALGDNTIAADLPTVSRRFIRDASAAGTVGNFSSQPGAGAALRGRVVDIVHQPIIAQPTTGDENLTRADPSRNPRQAVANVSGGEIRPADLLTRPRPEYAGLSATPAVLPVHLRSRAADRSASGASTLGNRASRRLRQASSSIGNLFTRPRATTVSNIQSEHRKENRTLRRIRASYSNFKDYLGGGGSGGGDGAGGAGDAGGGSGGMATN